MMTENHDRQVGLRRQLADLPDDPDCGVDLRC